MIIGIIFVKDLNSQLTLVTQPKEPVTIIISIVIDIMVVKDLISLLTLVSRPNKLVQVIIPITLVPIQKNTFILLAIIMVK